ncbi:MAG: chorismate mutase [Chitinophagales bacterium]|nr:chorismate mutase [Chitinophagales bacterium]
MTNSETSIASDAQPPGMPMRVCIQGYAGAFHEIAARNCFRDQPIEIVPAHTFNDLVEMIEAQQQTDIGLMAIENTLAGSLMSNYQLLNESKLTITGEVYLRIKQNLMVLPGQRIEDLNEVHSHPVAIAQCREFFSNYPHIHLVETADTALSAKLIQEKKQERIGAIASTLAAEIYGMEIIAASIETNKKNHTRFLVLEPKAAKKEIQEAKVSLSFSVEHQPGSLYKVLAVLAAYKVNLTKIQSMPIIGMPWEYRFFIDFIAEGSHTYQQALDAIKPLTHNLKVLGVYEKGEHFEY